MGIVLGPLRFLTYINDMPDSVTSKKTLFADDSLVCRRFSGEKDAVCLQEDLNKLQDLDKIWVMNCYPDKG